MARKTTPPAKTAKKAAETAVRPTATTNPPQPAKANGKASGPALSHETLAQRAYKIWQLTGNPSESANWAEAERQLRAEFGVRSR